jgi:hypothetical protein
MPVLSYVHELFNVDQCHAYIHTLRWKDRPLQCPRCQSEEVDPWGNYHYRPGCKRYWCHGCKRTFNDLTDTLLHQSKRSLPYWILARVVKKPEANFLAAVIPWSAARFSYFFMGAGVDWPLGTLLLRLSLREQHLLQRTPVLPTAAAQSPRGQLGHTPRVAHRRPAADACAATHRPA